MPNIIDRGVDMEKKEYCSPEVEIITFSSKDVITKSYVGGEVIITPDDQFR